jgi:hypothetical protein
MISLAAIQARLDELQALRKLATARADRARIASQIRACKILIGFANGWRA